MKKPAAEASTQNSAPDQLSLAVSRPEEEVGARLRQQRLKRRIAVPDAARALKLTQATVEDIERGDLDRHPALYRRGYLRNYARFLGLDPEPLLSLLEVAEAPPLRPVLPVTRRGANFERLLRIATYAIVTTLIIPPLVLIYIQGGLSFMERPLAVAVGEGIVGPPSTDIGARELGQSARPLGMRDAEPEALTGPVTASALPLSSIRPVRDVAAESAAAARLDASPTGMEPDSRSVLVIDLLEDSWLEIYAADGRRLEYDLLRAGVQRRYTAEGPFQLLLGRASAVSVELDGVPISFDGQDLGGVASFELSADGMVRQ